MEEHVGGGIGLVPTATVVVDIVVTTGGRITILSLPSLMDEFVVLCLFVFVDFKDLRGFLESPQDILQTSPKLGNSPGHLTLNQNIFSVLITWYIGESSMLLVAEHIAESRVLCF